MIEKPSNSSTSPELLSGVDTDFIIPVDEGDCGSSDPGVEIVQGSASGEKRSQCEFSYSI